MSLLLLYRPTLGTFVEAFYRAYKAFVATFRKYQFRAEPRLYVFLADEFYNE